MTGIQLRSARTLELMGGLDNRQTQPVPPAERTDVITKDKCMTKNINYTPIPHKSITSNTHEHYKKINTFLYSKTIFETNLLF